MCIDAKEFNGFCAISAFYRKCGAMWCAYEGKKSRLSELAQRFGFFAFGNSGRILCVDIPKELTP
jgi:hypothetical protein